MRKTIVTDTFPRELREALAGASAPLPGPEGAVRWVALGWDDPAAAELRALMDAEIKPRYAPYGPRPHLPPPPTADEIAVTWVAFAVEILHVAGHYSMQYVSTWATALR